MISEDFEPLRYFKKSLWTKLTTAAVANFEVNLCPRLGWCKSQWERWGDCSPITGSPVVMELLSQIISLSAVVL